MQLRHYLLCSCLLLALLTGACKSAAPNETIQYEYLVVERQGGGQLDFRIYPGDSRSTLNVFVSSSNFQPVDRRFQLHIDSENVDAFDDFYKALNGQLPLSGIKVASKGLTGTWLNFRFVRGNRQTEVSNPDLFRRFEVFENLVRSSINN
jgi:hypothetical protein